MKRFAAMLAVSVLMVLWIASGDRMSAGQRTDGLYYGSPASIRTPC